MLQNGEKCVLYSIWLVLATFHTFTWGSQSIKWFSIKERSWILLHLNIFVCVVDIISTYSWAFRGRFWLSNLYYSFDVMRSHVYYLFVINCLETLNGSLAKFCFCCHLQRYFVSSNFDCFNSVGIKNKSCCFFLSI